MTTKNTKPTNYVHNYTNRTPLVWPTGASKPAALVPLNIDEISFLVQCMQVKEFLAGRLNIPLTAIQKDSLFFCMQKLQSAAADIRSAEPAKPTTGQKLHKEGKWAGAAGSN